MGFHIDWHAIPKPAFMSALKQELLMPGYALDRLLTPHVKQGAVGPEQSAAHLGNSPTLIIAKPVAPTTTTGPSF